MGGSPRREPDRSWGTTDYERRPITTHKTVKETVVTAKSFGSSQAARRFSLLYQSRGRPVVFSIRHREPRSLHCCVWSRVYSAGPMMIPLKISFCLRWPAPYLRCVLSTRCSILDLRSSLLTARHRITLSARASTFGGIIKPICSAAFKLMMNSNFFARSTGRSAGLAPFKILSTIVAARHQLSIMSWP